MLEGTYVASNPQTGGGRRGTWIQGHLGQEGLDHKVHAANINVHSEIPVSLLCVQDGAVVHVSRRATCLQI